MKIIFLQENFYAEGIIESFRNRAVYTLKINWKFIKGHNMPFV